MVYFGPLWSNSIDSVYFGPFQSNLVHSAQFGPFDTLLKNGKRKVGVESIVLKTRMVKEAKIVLTLGFY